MGKKSPSPPPPPDPVATANAQAAANLAAMKTNLRYNRIPETAPGLNISYIRDAEGIPIHKTTTLGPTQQALFNKSQNVALDLANRAGQLVSGVPTTPFNYDGLPSQVSNVDLSALPALNPVNYQTSIDRSNSARDRVEQSLYNRSASLLEPGFARAQQDLEQNLRDRGIPRDSQAWDYEMAQLSRNQNEARQRIADQAVAAGGNEASRIFGVDQQAANFTNQALQNQFATNQTLRQQALSEAQQNAAMQNQARATGATERLAQRNQAVNEASAAVTGRAALPSYQLGGIPQFSTSAPDIMSATYQSHNAAMQNYQARIAQQNATMQGIGQLAGAVVGGIAMSHSSFKEDWAPASPVLEALADLPIGTWRYDDRFADRDRHIGPMAEHFRDAFGIGDGVTLSLVDVMGVLLKAMQELSDKLNRLERQPRRRTGYVIQSACSPAAQ